MWFRLTGSKLSPRSLVVLVYYLISMLVGYAGRRQDGPGSLPNPRSSLPSRNHLFVQYTLDETWVRIQGGMDGHSASIVDKALTEAADAQPDLADGTRGDRSWRRATALVELCATGDSPPAQVTVFVDAGEATVSNGEAGVMFEAGPKVGVQASRSDPL